MLLAVVAAGVGGCSTGGSAGLGGRQKCWSDQRAASLWRGILRIDAYGGTLDTPEGDVIALQAGTLRMRVGETGGELVQGETVAARDGDDVTLFGGAGSDGYLVVCAVEETHAKASA
jgi:hypothetical protein